MRQALGWRFPRDALVVSIESTDMGVSRQGGNGLHIVIRVFLHQSGGMLNALTVDIVGERFAREIGDGSLDVGTVGMEQSGHLVDLQVVAQKELFTIHELFQLVGQRRKELL